MNAEKEKIFRRIREALKISAPYPGHHGGGSNGEVHTEAPQDGIAHWLPPVGSTFDAQADLFARNSVGLKSAFHLLENESAATQKLAEISRAEAWRRIAAHGDGAAGPSTRAMVTALGLPGIWTDSGYDVREMENCDAGVTECDALIAQTGSVLVTSRSAGGRALSVLPPHHVVLARRDQMVADLPAAFALLTRKYAENYPSFIGFVTGPSRTGDIERILVLGAHGPKKLTILCW
jgi:L-lactate dehydrogenase complex protein LldG